MYSHRKWGHILSLSNLELASQDPKTESFWSRLYISLERSTALRKSAAVNGFTTYWVTPPSLRASSVVWRSELPVSIILTIIRLIRWARTRRSMPFISGMTMSAINRKNGPLDSRSFNASGPLVAVITWNELSKYFVMSFKITGSSSTARTRLHSGCELFKARLFQWWSYDSWLLCLQTKKLVIQIFVSLIRKHSARFD